MHFNDLILVQDQTSIQAINRKPLIQFCQFCSKKLKNHEVQCPYCGIPISMK